MEKSKKNSSLTESKKDILVNKPLDNSLNSEKSKTRFTKEDEASLMDLISTPKKKSSRLEDFFLGLLAGIGVVIAAVIFRFIKGKHRRGGLFELSQN